MALKAVKLTIRKGQVRKLLSSQNCHDYIRIGKKIYFGPLLKLLVPPNPTTTLLASFRELKQSHFVLNDNSKFTC